MPNAENMSAEDLEKYETEMELQLYREYRDVVGLFTHVVETERRFYLTSDVENVRVVTFKDVNIEELAKSDLQLPEET